MTVLITQNTPDAIRGHLKRWFIEPKPNVYVGTVNARTKDKVLKFIFRNAPSDFGALIISSAPNTQGYVIDTIGDTGRTGRKHLDISGLYLIAENWIEDDNIPF